MRLTVAIIYNQPDQGRYFSMGENRAVEGVLDEVKAVHQALVGKGHTATRVGLCPPLGAVVSSLRQLRADVVFNLFEGFDGSPETEALVARALSDVGLPFTGCPGEALALGLDKGRAKGLLAKAGIDTPRFQVLGPEGVGNFDLEYPCIVKPLNEDASHGLNEDSIVHNMASLREQVQRVSRLFGGHALVEEFVDGREFNATVLGNKEPVVLPPSEIEYSLPAGKPRLLTYAAKWEPDNDYCHHTKAVCPANVDSELGSRLRKTARDVFLAFGCRGYARVDMRLDSQGNVMVLEVNPNPDISPDAGAAKQARAAGMEYDDFVEKILMLALEKV
ncbi:MAG: ATP-grasp domain-containing protein [Chloroflexi bacterium]|nr:ATP-grasp domain-containing protein [Chloroflexota bacterium]